MSALARFLYVLAMINALAGVGAPNDDARVILTVVAVALAAWGGILDLDAERKRAVSDR